MNKKIDNYDYNFHISDCVLPIIGGVIIGAFDIHWTFAIVVAFFSSTWNYVERNRDYQDKITTKHGQLGYFFYFLYMSINLSGVTLVSYLIFKSITY